MSCKAHDLRYSFMRVWYDLLLYMEYILVYIWLCLYMPSATVRCHYTVFIQTLTHINYIWIRILTFSLANRHFHLKVQKQDGIYIRHPKIRLRLNSACTFIVALKTDGPLTMTTALRLISTIPCQNVTAPMLGWGTNALATVPALLPDPDGPFSAISLFLDNRNSEFFRLIRA